MILYPTLHLGRALPPFRVDDVFRVVTATGANLQDAIDATGLNPDLIIAKNVQSSSDWIWLAPSVMPGQKLSSNNYNAASAFSGFSGSSLHVAYLFKRKKGFFDLATWTGNGISGRVISHQLEQTPGWVMTKSRNTEDKWLVLPKAPAADYYIFDAPGILSANSGGYQEPAGPAGFKIGDHSPINGSGQQYVSFLFAAGQTSWDVIKCGRVQTTSSTQLQIRHGWAVGAQFVMLTSVGVTNEFFDIYDRGRSPGWADEKKLQLTSSAAENSGIEITDSNGVLTISGLTGVLPTRNYDVMLIRAAA